VDEAGRIDPITFAGEASAATGRGRASTGMPAKRIFDIAVCLLVLPVALPVMAIVAVVIRLTSGPPVLYRSIRIGRGGHQLAMLKFRTMRTTPGHQVSVTRHGDPRITPVGRILRLWKLDELPQLFNVLRGEMSLVGPRPEDPKFVEHYSLEERQVFAVVPGITGLAAVRFRHEELLLDAASDTDVDEYYACDVLHHKLALDVEYVRTRTLRLDIAILVQTLRVLVIRPDSHPTA
jgi:lipopolysaccharide/colanic/teichoic acid biosynthesis glycosyltransferase